MAAATRARRIGIFGGTFDPIHNGHLVVAEQVLSKLGLDEVLFVPAGDPWQKQTRASDTDRLSMVILALQEHPRYTVSTIDLDRPGPTYTIDTLTELREQYPRDELFFILGADAYRGIDSWHSADRLPELAQFVVVSRPTEGGSEPLPLRKGVNLLDIPALPVSSTQCRQAIREGQALTGLVPPKVAQYIQDHQLYRSDS